MKDPVSAPVKSCLILVSVIVAAALVVGCGGGGSGSSSSAAGDGAAQKGGTLRIAEETEVDTLDPIKGVLLSDANALEQMIEGLFQINDKGEAVPWLAEKYETSPDQREWTLHLRSGVTFSNGSRLEASDAVFSIDTVRESEIWSSLYEMITSVEAISPTTVVIKTNVPYPALPCLLAIFPAGIVPDKYGGVSEKEFGEHPIGTGPFEFASWKRGQSLTLASNPTYWKKGLPYLDKIEYVMAPEDNSRVAQLKAGELDVAGKPSWAQLSQLESTPGLTVAKAENSFVGSLFLNGKKPLFEDPRAREAVSLALDRDGITMAAMKGQGQPAVAWYPMAMRFSDTGLKPPAQDTEKAKELLAEAVAASGEDANIALLFPGEDEYSRTSAQVIAQNLGEAGFKVSLEPRDPATVNAEAEAGEFDMTLGTVVTIVPDPVEWYGYYLGTNALYTSAPQQAIGALINGAAHQVDPKKREQMYHQIQRQMVEENYLVNINDLPLTYGISESVHDLNVEWWGIVRLAETWLES